MKKGSTVKSNKRKHGSVVTPIFIVFSFFYIHFMFGLVDSDHDKKQEKGKEEEDEEEEREEEQVATKKKCTFTLFFTNKLSLHIQIIV